MMSAPDCPDRSRRADFHLSIAVAADEDADTLGETIQALLERAMLNRAPRLAGIRPAEQLLLGGQLHALQLSSMTAEEMNVFQFLKVSARADDGRLLLVRVSHGGRNRALIVSATPSGTEVAGAPSIDVHAVALLADEQLVTELG